VEQTNQKVGNTNESHGTFVPDPDELAVLARHYADWSYAQEAEWALFGQAGGASWSARALRWHTRLRAIEVILGKERMEQVLAPVRDRWDTIFADAAELANRRGVQDLGELTEGDPEAEALLARCGLVAVPQSRLHPMSSLPRVSTPDARDDGWT
jgi:hypothetical protein